MEYGLILFATLLISLFVLRLASSQGKRAKQNIRYIYLGLIVLTGFLGFGLAFVYPQSFFWLFFTITFIQAVFLIVNRPMFSTLVVALNFVNTFVFFVAIIMLSNLLGRQLINFASVVTIFLVLIGNVVGLVFINKDKKLLAKFPYG